MNSATEMDRERAARVLAVLDSHHVMCLATQGPSGPHAANLFYARQEFNLLWVSDPASEHSIHLEGAPRVAATVARDYADYRDVRGLQIVGNAHRIIDDAERSRARSSLEARYAFLRKLSEADGELRAAYARIQFYRLTPNRITLIDNSRGFGFKETIELPL